MYTYLEQELEDILQKEEVKSLKEELILKLNNERNFYKEENLKLQEELKEWRK